MVLSNEQIKDITLGATDSFTKDGVLFFKRMTDATATAFINENPDYDKKVRASCGIRFDFDTNSQYLYIKISKVSMASSRKFFYFDVYVDDELYMHVGKKSVEISDNCEVYAKLDGDEHRVRVFFPFSACAGVESVELSDGATFKKHDAKYVAVCYGDSITHGYTAIFPSMSYVNVMARRMDVEVYNQAIGGAIFNRNVPDKIEGVTPDFITVAYGTNDWSRYGINECIFDECEAFLEKVKSAWGDTPIYVILPIYRGDWDKKDKAHGDFFEYRRLLGEVCKMQGVTVIDSIDFTPHSKEMFVPDFLHPNDYGFYQYGNRLCDVIEEDMNGIS